MLEGAVDKQVTKLAVVPLRATLGGSDLGLCWNGLLRRADLARIEHGGGR